MGEVLYLDFYKLVKMSTAVYNIAPDALEKKFFDLVVQPSTPVENSAKPLEKSIKSDKKIEKRQRNRLVYWFNDFSFLCT